MVRSQGERAVFPLAYQSMAFWSGTWAGWEVAGTTLYPAVPILFHFCLFYFFETESQYVAQAGLEL
jgi:hypothetical protein